MTCGGICRIHDLALKDRGSGAIPGQVILDELSTELREKLPAAAGRRGQFSFEVARLYGSPAPLFL
jgi:hypothetical protein